MRHNESPKQTNRQSNNQDVSDSQTQGKGLYRDHALETRNRGSVAVVSKNCRHTYSSKRDGGGLCGGDGQHVAGPEMQAAQQLLQTSQRKHSNRTQL